MRRPTHYGDSTLSGGVRVVTEPMADVRSAAIGFWVVVGSRDERPEEAGCSHFLEHLLFKGTHRRSARDIAEALDDVGGEMNAFTSKEVTCFHARVLDRDLSLAVDVLADMLASATNRPEHVDAERQVVLEEINIHLDSPDDLSHSDLARALLGDHPLADETLGTTPSITGMPRDRIHDYYQRWYRPTNIVVTAAGSLHHDTVVDLVEERLGDLTRPGGERPVRSAPPGAVGGSVHVRHRPTEQAHVVMGGPGLARDDDRRYAVRVLNALLGGGMSSRLFQEIRETRGLAYSTYSYTASYADGGYYGAYAGTTPHRIDDLLKVLREQLDGLADSITAGEVQRAKGSVRGSSVLSLEDTGSRMVRLGKFVSADRDLVSVEESLERIDEVSLEDVRAVAADLYSQPRSLAIVGPFDEDETERFRSYVA